MKKYAVEYKLQVPMGGVRLTGFKNGMTLSLIHI